MIFLIYKMNTITWDNKQYYVDPDINAYYYDKMWEREKETREYWIQQLNEEKEAHQRDIEKIENLKYDLLEAQRI